MAFLGKSVEHLIKNLTKKKEKNGLSFCVLSGRAQEQQLDML